MLEQREQKKNLPPKNSTIHRGSRCGLCYWALYDGDWCQNPKCAFSGKSVGANRIHLTNKEAEILINAKETEK